MQCCKGFHYLLLTGIVHNDIKGDNILISKVNFGEWQHVFGSRHCGLKS